MSNTGPSAKANPNMADAAVGKGDGRMHSRPHNKYGPYTCPKCGSMFSKSQSFAAHAKSHYKEETAEEKVRRLMSRKNNRTQCVQVMSNKITLASSSSHVKAAVLENTNNDQAHRVVKEEKVDQDLDQIQRTTQGTLDRIKDHLGPPPGFEGHPRYGDAKTTQGTLDHIKDHLGPPPGFEGHPRYGDAKTTQRTLDHIKDHLGPPPGFEGHPHYGDVERAERTLHNIKDHLGPPPGFEGHPRYGDAKIKSELDV